MPSGRARLPSALAAAWLVAFTTQVHAHAMSASMNHFNAGFVHPLTAFEHVLAFAAVGLLIGQHGLQKAQFLILIFPLAVALGAAGARALPGLPLVAATNLVSLILFGALTALAKPLPHAALLAFCCAFGLTHGYANGSATTAQTSMLAFAAGLFAATFLVVAYGAAAAQYLLQRKISWIDIAVRVAGSWIAAIGLMALAIGMRGGLGR